MEGREGKNFMERVVNSVKSQNKTEGDESSETGTTTCYPTILLHIQINFKVTIASLIIVNL